MTTAQRSLSSGLFGNSELMSRILFTITLLIVYRIGVQIPIPGANPEVIQAFLAGATDDSAGGSSLFNMINTFTGGALQNLSVLLLGVFPYISASIIVQLLTAVLPSFQALKKEGPSGQRQINRYTRYLTILLAIAQGLAIAVGLQSQQALATDPRLFFLAAAVISFTSGTVFLMWLGEQITERGIGNGISLIIYIGIISDLPRVLASIFDSGDTEAYVPVLILLGAIALFAFIVFVERAQRRLVIQYPRRQVGQRIVGGNSSFMPLKLNTSGVIPPIFATALLSLPATVATVFSSSGPEWLRTLTAALNPGQWLYILIFVALVIFFAFFYTAIMFDPKEKADELRRFGGNIPGIRPGDQTARYVDHVLTRLTVVGALYLTFVCVLPMLALGNLGAAFLGGTSLLIMVTVTLDTVGQVQAHMLAKQYESRMKAQERMAGTGRRKGNRAQRRGARSR